MKRTVNIRSNKIEIIIPNSSSLQDLKTWRVLIRNLLFIFLNKKVGIITIAPQKYSVDQEIGNGEKYSFGGSKYLINNDIVLDKHIVDLLADSEDFERGLLLIVLSGSPASIIEHLSQLDQSKAELIALNADGNSFNWYNPSSEQEINAMRVLI
jgi:hypothetical protein